MTCDFCGERRREERPGVGGRYFGYKNTRILEGWGSRHWMGPCFYNFCHCRIHWLCACVLQPFPVPDVSLMYINPDSRGQCVLGEVKLLSSQSIAFNLHSSACGPHSGPELCVLLFQRRAVYLELIRGTHGPEWAWIYLCVCLHAFLQSVYVCSFVLLWNTSSFFLMFYTMGCNICHAKNLKPFLTDWSTNQSAEPLGNRTSDGKCCRHLLSNSGCTRHSPVGWTLPVGLTLTPPVTLCSPSSVTC